jgi:hypothetical protein
MSFDYEQFGFAFMAHLKTKGDCTLFVGNHGYNKPRFKGRDVRAMVADIPKDAFVYPGCGENSCINPDHFVTLTKATSKASACDSLPKGWPLPKPRRVRSYTQFKKEFLEV